MVEGAETLNRALLEGLTPDEARDVGRVVGEELASADASVRAFLVTLVGAAWALRRAERDADGGIRSFGDALWCSFNALTTTGESGCPPVTGWGRVVAGALMLVGTPLYAQVQERVARMVGRLSGSAPAPVARPPAEGQGASAPPVAPVPSAALDALLERVKAASELMARTQAMVARLDAAATANRHLLEEAAQRAAVTRDVEGKLDAILELLREVSTALPQPTPEPSSPPSPSPSPSPLPSPLPSSSPSPSPLSPLLSQVIQAAAARTAAAAQPPSLPSSPPAPRASLAEQLRAAAGPLAAAGPSSSVRSAPSPSPVPPEPARPPKGQKKKRRRK